MRLHGYEGDGNPLVSGTSYTAFDSQVSDAVTRDPGPQPVEVVRGAAASSLMVQDALSILVIIVVTECGAAWQRTRLGAEGSQVRFLSFRLLVHRKVPREAKHLVNIDRNIREL